MTSLLLSTLHGNAHWPPPLWLMRQAGRYLPEYRALRAQAGGFLDLVYNPELAAEVTLQPIRRFDFDAAILFSDILVVPHALGRALTFAAGEGPRLDPLTCESELAALQLGAIETKLAPVCETVARVRAQLDPAKALIGFCGAPWTVATYMIAGRGGDEQEAAKLMAYTKPAFLDRLIEILVEASVIYLKAQIKAGAQVVQLFDSWAGALDSFAFHQFVIAPTQKIVAAVRASHPTIPVIGFARGCGALLKDYAALSGVQAVGVDWQQDLAQVARNLAVPFQGNLDPFRLLGPPAALDKILATIKSHVKDKPYIFNLGHGILQQTPVETVDYLVSALRQKAG